MLRILLVDDDAVIRQGLRMLLELKRNLTVIGETGDGETALALAHTLKPDVVVMETTLACLSGIQTAEKISASVPECAVVILSLKDDAETRARAHAAGAKAFVGKHETPRVLLEAIQQVGVQAQVRNVGQMEACDYAK